MKQGVTRLGNGARGPTQGEKLIIYNRGMRGINELKNPSGKCEGRGGG
jgi:hypothetical protein